MLTKGTEYSQYNLLVKGGNVLQPAQSNHKTNVPKCIQKTEDIRMMMTEMIFDFQNTQKFTLKLLRTTDNMFVCI